MTWKGYCYGPAMNSHNLPHTARTEKRVKFTPRSKSPTLQMGLGDQ